MSWDEKKGAEIPLKYVLFLLLALPALSRAQSTVIGLGNYSIGITTPDSLNRSEFREEDPSYVKGTIALPCNHIRTFTAATVQTAGGSLANVVLVFYDNTLAKVSCDYDESLRAVFLKQYGTGVSQPVKNVHFCTSEKGKPLSIWGDVWPGGDVVAFVVQWKGYVVDCKMGQGARLIIASQRLSALSSDCDIKPADPIGEEFSKAYTSTLRKQR